MNLSPVAKNLVYRTWKGLVSHYGSHRRDVLLWPPVESSRQLDDLLPRLQFHFASRRASKSRIVIPLRNPGMRPSGRHPSYMGFYEERCRTEIVYTPVPTSGTNLLDAARNYGGVLLTRPAEEVGGGKWMKYLPNVVPFDPSDVEMETFWIAKLFYRRSRKAMRQNRRKFNAWVTSLPKRKHVYLLCTGPSLSRFAEFDFSDGYVIGCNSVVSNEALMDHARPDFVVASDPIFHFGPSVYAEKFREDLAAASRKHRFLFMTLDVYHHLIDAHLSMPGKRVCEVPIRSGHSSTALSRSWSVPRTANIMTMFMLPLAHSLARNIHIIGADGREPGETYFWKHDPASQLTDRMQAIKDCHPAFFEKRNYVDYYDRHCQIVDAQVRQIEREGGRVDSLTPSYIPALKDRPARRS